MRPKRQPATHHEHILEATSSRLTGPGSPLSGSKMVDRSPRVCVLPVAVVVESRPRSGTALVRSAEGGEPAIGARNGVLGTSCKRQQGLPATKPPRHRPTTTRARRVQVQMESPTSRPEARRSGLRNQCPSRWLSSRTQFHVPSLVEGPPGSLYAHPLGSGPGGSVSDPSPDVHCDGFGTARRCWLRRAEDPRRGQPVAWWVGVEPSGNKRSNPSGVFNMPGAVPA